MAKSGRRYTWKNPTPTPSDSSGGVASRGKTVAAQDDDNDNGFNLGWRKYAMEKLFVTLRTSPSGLTSARAAAVLVSYGGNELEAKKRNMLSKLLPVAVEVAAAVAMAIGLARGGGRAVFAALVALLAADLAVGIAETYSAGITAANALVARLAPSGRACWVLRDGVWSEKDTAALLLGDVIWIKSGDVVPADARLLEGSTPMTIKIDQSALPVAKWPGDAVYAGSACAKGETKAVVVAGGAHTYLADAVRLADTRDVAQWCCPCFQRAFRAVWNACVVCTCFVLLDDAVAGNLGRYDDDTGIGVLMLVVFILAYCAFVWSHSKLWEVSWEERRRCRRVAKHGRDPEELMRKLGALREQGKISDETAQRCRDLFGEDRVCDELATTLASYLGRGRVTPLVAERRPAA